VLVVSVNLGRGPFFGQDPRPLYSTDGASVPWMFSWLRFQGKTGLSLYTPVFLSGHFPYTL
jgi:hypothetical protein